MRDFQILVSAETAIRDDVSLFKQLNNISASQNFVTYSETIKCRIKSVPGKLLVVHPENVRVPYL